MSECIPECTLLCSDVMARATGLWEHALRGVAHDHSKFRLVLNDFVSSIWVQSTCVMKDRSWITIHGVLWSRRGAGGPGRDC